GERGCGSLPLLAWDWRDVAEEDLLFLLVDDDARRHHDEQTLRFAAIRGVAEKPVDVRNFVQDGRPGLVAAFRKCLEAAQQDRAAVGHADRRVERNLRERRLLEEHLE